MLDENEVSMCRCIRLVGSVALAISALFFEVLHARSATLESGHASSISAIGPIGFGAGTTGGAAPETSVVTVTRPQDLVAALCSSVNNGICTDNAPRIIRIAGILDFRGLEGSKTAEGCVSSERKCLYKGKQEQILNGLRACTSAKSETYAVTLDAAGTTPLLVGSNKTVIGVDATSGLKGKGLKLIGGVSNVIIRNLSITDINDGIVWGGDAITIDGASKVWVDHNYIARIGRQQIVTGWGAAQDVTISNNDFDGTSDYGHYCNDRTYWMFLLLGSNQTITLANNRIHSSSGRSPKVGSSSPNNGGIVHLVNNYYDDNYGPGGLSGSDAVAVLVEGNYFAHGDSFHPIGDNTPNKTDANSELNFAPISRNINAAQKTCVAILGRGCRANIDKANLDEGAAFLLNPAAMSKIRSLGPSAVQAVKAVIPMDPSAVPAQAFGPQAGMASP